MCRAWAHSGARPETGTIPVSLLADSSCCVSSAHLTLSAPTMGPEPG